MASKKATTVKTLMKTVCSETDKRILQFTISMLRRPSWATTMGRSFFGITIQVPLSIKLFSVLTIKYIQSEIRLKSCSCSPGRHDEL